MSAAPAIEALPTWKEMVRKIEDRETHLSFSAIRAFAQSPRHFMEYKLRQRETTPAMAFGSMVHCLVLEPDEFDDRYFAAPDVDKRTKAGKAEYEIAVEEAGNREIVSGKDMEHAKRIADELRRNSASRWVLDELGETEKSVEWNDYGYNWRGYVDGVGDELVMDLKTVADANPKRLRWKIYEELYHIQGTLYTIKGLKQRKPFFILAVDKGANISVIEVNEAIQVQALEELERIMGLFRKCVALNQWWQSYDFYAPNGIYKLSSL